MSSDSSDSRNRRPHFALLFVIALLLCAAATFAVFTWYARVSIAGRREANRAHLHALGEALDAFSRDPKSAGTYPADARMLFPSFVQDAETFVNPSWPDGAGYLYVSGVTPDDPPGTLLLIENVPPRKEKLGRLVLLRDGSVQALTQQEYEQARRAQEARWKELKRAWKLIEIEP